jgi:uracil-DNA glycosylase
MFQNLNLDEHWLHLFQEEGEKDYFKQLYAFLKTEVKSQTIYPPKPNTFSAFEYTSFQNVKAVILGQDPYHGQGQANGLCFSVHRGLALPPSLKNIFVELESDLGIKIPSHGDLSSWAKQGVLMLNATLTVRANEAGSHQKKGWEIFTDNIIKHISEQKENVVFLLWGNYAKAKVELINASKHHILTAAHPSPLARGAYFGSKHFSQTNVYLKSKGITEIDWNTY